MHDSHSLRSSRSVCWIVCESFQPQSIRLRLHLHAHQLVAVGTEKQWQQWGFSVDRGYIRRFGHLCLADTMWARNDINICRAKSVHHKKEVHTFIHWKLSHSKRKTKRRMYTIIIRKNVAADNCQKSEIKLKNYSKTNINKLLTNCF